MPKANCVGKVFSHALVVLSLAALLASHDAMAAGKVSDCQPGCGAVEGVVVGKTPYGVQVSTTGERIHGISGIGGYVLDKSVMLKRGERLILKFVVQNIGSQPDAYTLQVQYKGGITVGLASLSIKSKQLASGESFVLEVPVALSEPAGQAITVSPDPTQQIGAIKVLASSAAGLAVPYGFDSVAIYER